MQIERRNKQRAHHHATKIMGCNFVISALHKNGGFAWDAMRAAEREMRRIEELISSWKDNSETDRINRLSGVKACKVSLELFELIERSLKVSYLSSGCFDISGTLSRYYWNFNKQENKFLDQESIEILKRLIDYRNIEINKDECTVFLKNKGMKIGFGGIGKGYAANRAKSIMKIMGIESGVINASGDLICWGNNVQQNEWKIKIPDPRDRRKALLEINLEYGSVVTSGSYENYSVIDGVRYSHIIDPRTAIPVVDTKNVTVICPDAEFGDALATAVSVLGAKQGIHLINQINGVECIVIDQFDECHFSKNLIKSISYA